MPSLFKFLRFAALVWICLTVVILVATSYTGQSSPTDQLPLDAVFANSPLDVSDCPPPATPPSDTQQAVYRSPAELLCRPLATNRSAVPKLFHQSWKSTVLPAKFWRWSSACRNKHPDWEWVLWTDDDNLQLVRKHFPALEDTYLSLPGDIYRVDLARNLYMYLFGG